MSPIITCLDCKQSKRHRGNGLCDACYQRARHLKRGGRSRCSMSGCPAFQALPDIGLCKGHISDELASLSDAEFESRIAEMFAGRFAVVGECWEFRGTLHTGYGRITLKTDGIRQRIFVHHLVVQFRIGRPLVAEEDEFALHHCDNRPCFRPAHLYKGSHDDNAADAVERGRTARGDRNPRAKLNPEQIREVFARYKPGWSQWDRGNASELAQEFGVDKSTINRLTRMGHWSLAEVAPAGRRRNPGTRLTPEQIREIAARHRPGFTRWDRGNTAQLAQEFGVSKGTITKLAERERKSLQEVS